MPFVLFAGGVSVLFFASAQLLTRHKQPLHYCMIVGCVAASYVLLYLWARQTGMLLRVPALTGTDTAAVFLAAPSFYLASLTVLHEGRRPVRSYAVYFIVPGILALCSVGYDVLTAPAFLLEHGRVPDHLSDTVRMILSLTASLSLVAAIVLDLLAALRLHRSGRVQQRKDFRSQVVFLFWYLAASLVILLRFVFHLELLYPLGVLAFGIIILVYGLSHIVVSHVAPETSAPETAARPLVRAPGNPAWDQTAADLSVRLEKLMENAAPYRDEHLTLRALATQLGVEPKRLSYHLHAHLGQSFRSYINEWRLKAVSRDLLADPERSILETALDNGFNSKSSFNTLFYRKFGATPREYRKRQAGG